MDIKDQKVIVKTLNDVRKAISNLLIAAAPAAPVKIGTTMQGEDQAGHKQRFKVEAAVNAVNYHTMLMDGLTILRKRAELLAVEPDGVVIGGHQMVPPPLLHSGHHWVDDIIEQRLGGKREGLRIVWNIPEGVFNYDPFTQKLTKNV